MKETDAISVAINMYNDGYNKAIDDITEKYFDAIEEILHDKELKLELNQALTIYARIMNKCGFIAEQLKER